ncbi:MAG TPA: single-stranded-DNA-specific exonuclease RecJ [Alphaproteobacteria bacterium]|nr:single-stranded-DNA-specific exonuclease RecJ [Alphaproteobacteria bacterium]
MAEPLPLSHDAATPALLGVARSFSGKRWQARAGDDRLALALAQRCGVAEIIGRVLAARGVGLDHAQDFLNPTLRALLPDPNHLLDMAAAAERIAGAVMAGETVAVFGDYDVDGATATAVLVRFLRAVGGTARLYIPDRIDEGYGPNAPALIRLKEEGAGLIVCVDCGTTAFAALEGACAAGADIVVIDHHTAEPKLPAVRAVVNPNRVDETSPHRTLCAAGLAYLTVVAVNRLLRDAGWYRDRPAPDLLQWLDLVALGTVCDVVPLAGLNRALVSQGIKVLGRRDNIGLAALADVARVQDRPGAYHLGFLLGPRINAGGRVGRADLGARLLTTDDPREAAQLAQQLDQLNEERRQIEALVLEEAMALAERDDSPILVLAGEGWHPGVIGIVAGRVKERFNRPTLVIGINDGIGKASGRSIAGVDLGGAVIAARQAGLLVAGGGHAMAAGLTVEPDRIPELRAFLVERVVRQLGGMPPVAQIAVDGVIACGAANLDLAASLDRLQPFGSGNAEPVFAIAGLRVVKADIVGQGHVRAIFTGADGTRLKGIAFRCADNDMGGALLRREMPVHVAGHVRRENWQGSETVSFIIDDAAPAWGAGG